MRILVWSVALVAWAVRLGAWDYEVHRVVNQIALASLPASYPAFVREPANAERIAFLAGEADRWRNSPDLVLRHVNSPDHFLDLEDLEPLGLNPTNVSSLRHEFVAQVVAARAKEPAKFPADAKDNERNRWIPGFLPWRIAEDYGRLKSAFSYLKAFEQHGGTPEEIANARANVVYLMGLMGHFVGDAAQPLHTTRHYNGWVGDNPQGYTTNRSFHAWIDGRYLQKVGLNAPALVAAAKPARPVWEGGAGATREDVFPAAMRFLVDQFAVMEPLYRLEKEGRLSGNGERGLEGRAVLEQQLARGGQMLGDLWLSAWQAAPPDNYLIGQLNRRKLGPDAGK